MADNTTLKARQAQKGRQSVKDQGPPRWAEVLEDHRARQRERILAVALDLLRERGMAALTMSAIAEQAGISRPTLYHYFPTVDAVLAAWVGQEIERSVSAMLVQARAIPDPLDRLAYLVATQARTFASQHHRLSAEHFESEAGSPAVRREVEARMAPLRQLVVDTIAQAGACGLLRSPVDPVLAADLLLGLLGAIRRRLVAGTVHPDEAVRSIMQLLRSGWFQPRLGNPPGTQEAAPGQLGTGKSSTPTGTERACDVSACEVTTPADKSVEGAARTAANLRKRIAGDRPM